CFQLSPADDKLPGESCFAVGRTAAGSGRCGPAPDRSADRWATTVRPPCHTAAQFAVVTVDAPQEELVADLIGAAVGPHGRRTVVDDELLILHGGLKSGRGEPLADLLQGFGAGHRRHTPVNVHVRTSRRRLP